MAIEDNRRFYYSHFMVLPRSLLLLLPLLQAAPVYAEVAGYFTASTNYLWRGVTQTGDKPAVSAAVEYHAEQGSYLGVWASNIDYGDRTSVEVDTYLGHRFDLYGVGVELAVRNYCFPSGGKYNYDFRPDKWEDEDSSTFTELQAGVTYAGLNGRYSYSNSYLDSGERGYYIELNYTHTFTNALSLHLHIGSQGSRAIDDTQYTVSDQSATLKWGNFFFTASDMCDNEDGRQSDHARYLAGWSVEVR